MSQSSLDCVEICEAELCGVVDGSMRSSNIVTEDSFSDGDIDGAAASGLGVGTESLVRVIVRLCGELVRGVNFSRPAAGIDDPAG